jgi:hypothetical protein
MHHLVFLAFPLVLLLPGRGRRRGDDQDRRRQLVSVAVLVVGVVALADPLGGNGRHPVTAALRVLAMVALVAAGPALVDVETRPADGDVPDMTDQSVRGAAGNAGADCAGGRR